MMRYANHCALLIAAAMVTGALAHLCNNIYRTPERVVVKPERQTVTVADREQVRVFVQNNYPTYLHNIRLSASVEGNGVSVSVEPDVVKVLKAGERTSFTVHIKADGGAPKRQYTLKLSISANEIGFRPVEEPSIEELRRTLTHPPGAGSSVLAAESLVRLKDAAGLKWLLNVMMDERAGRDPRSRAIRALGKGGAKESIPALRGMLQHRDGFLRGNALLSLGLLKDEPTIFYNMFKDEDEFVRACAVAGLALSGVKTKEVIDWLMQALNASNVYVRIACGWALSVHGYKEGVKALDAAFTTNDPMQRVMAGDALVDIASRQ
ncbi:MAG: hypothetical protein RMK18_10005 [Armatimonadota bacterium]|nr:hypothetical protein [Armatimonadota bacterium]MCX7778116.1 hypothetical protein [Armatimonadota bacterium]MDW8026177.1 hypothetical protein [Armatimonadota bacterium]